VIFDDMGLTLLPKWSGSSRFEIVLRPHEVQSMLMTINRDCWRTGGSCWGRSRRQRRSWTGFCTSWRTSRSQVEVTAWKTVRRGLTSPMRPPGREPIRRPWAGSNEAGWHPTQSKRGRWDCLGRAAPVSFGGPLTAPVGRRSGPSPASRQRACGGKSGWGP
jgi:hypothetical protein